MNITKTIWTGLRLSMSIIFLWAFFDKLLGLGFATPAERAWISGGSPTYGFLTNATKGPFAEFFQSLAGVPLVDWLFMSGLLFVGLALLTKRLMTLSALAGGTMMLLMWLAVLPPENNPLIDDHIVYIFVLVLLALETKREGVV